MLEFQGRKKKNKKKLYGLIFLLFLVLFFVILSRSSWNIWQKKIRSGRDLKTTELRLEELRKRQIDLTAELENLESRQGQEEEIVKKFDVVREGEGLAIILEPEIVPEEQKEEGGFFSRFFKKIFRRN